MKPATRRTIANGKTYDGFDQDFENSHVLLLARDDAGAIHCYALDDHEHAQTWLRYVDDTDSPLWFVGMYDQADPMVTLASLLGDHAKT